MPTYYGASVDTWWRWEAVMLAHTTLRGATTPPPVQTYMRLSVSHRASECHFGRHHRLPVPSGYPQTPHSM